MGQKIRIDFSNFSDEKYSTKLVVNTPEFRMVHFYLKAGQKVGLHASKSHVLTTVLKGKGKFFLGDESNTEVLNQGESIYYKPMEPHGFEAVEDMIVEAFISPNPSSKITLEK